MTKEQVEINCLICQQPQKIARSYLYLCSNNKQAFVQKNLKILERLFKNRQLETIKKIINSISNDSEKNFTCQNCQVALLQAELILDQVKLLEKKLDNLKGRLFFAFQSQSENLQQKSIPPPSANSNKNEGYTVSVKKEIAANQKNSNDEDLVDVNSDTDFSDYCISDDGNISDQEEGPAAGVDNNNIDDNDPLYILPDNEDSFDDAPNIKNDPTSTSSRGRSKKTIFKCNHCEASYKSIRFYNLHMQKMHKNIIKTENKPNKPEPISSATNKSNKFSVKCSKCELFFETKVLLQRHKRRKHNKVTCPICQKEMRYDVLSGHIREHKGLKPYKCDVCDERFSFKSKIKYHNAKCHPELLKFRCNFEGCTKVYLFPALLNNHVASSHSARDISCSKCDKKFILKKDYELHFERIHAEDRKTECTICHKMVTKINIGRHIRESHGERTFKCEICPTSKSTKYELIRHMKIHDPNYINPSIKRSNKISEKFVQCEICSKTFTKTYMRIHMGTHNEKNEVECELCSKKFSHPNLLGNHRYRMHGEIRSHSKYE